MKTVPAKSYNKLYGFFSSILTTQVLLSKKCHLSQWPVRILAQSMNHQMREVVRSRKLMGMIQLAPITTSLVSNISSLCTEKVKIKI